MKTDEFLLVNEAAEFLGVSANTIRAWAAAGKLPVYRHPVNNYRLFRRDDVEQLALRIANPKPVANTTRKAK